MAIVTKLVSYGLDFLSAQYAAEGIARQENQARAFDDYISSIERWDNINL